MLASTSYTSVPCASSSCSDARAGLPVGCIRRHQAVSSHSWSSSHLPLRTQKKELPQQLKSGMQRHRARLRSRCVCVCRGALYVPLQLASSIRSCQDRQRPCSQPLSPICCKAPPARCTPEMNCLHCPCIYDVKRSDCIEQKQAHSNITPRLHII